MTADRRVTVTSISGQNLLNELDDEIVSLNNRSICKMTVVGGTANALQVQVSPPIDPSSPSLVDGMRFEIEPTLANTSSLTIEIVDDNSPPGTVVAAKSVVDRDHAAIASGNWKATRKHLLTYDSMLNKLVVLTNIEPTPAAATPLPSFRNILANGGMEIWQRGAGGSASIAVGASTTAYTVDRWYITTAANQASTVFQSAGLSGRSRYCAVVQRNSGQTGTGGMVFAYPLTTEEVFRLRGAKATLQFKAQAGANFSPSSLTLSYAFYVGTSTEGKRGAGFTGETTVLSGSTNLSTGSISSINATSASAVPSNATQGEIRFTWTPVGTAGANDWFLLDDVQLEQSDTFTAFEYAPFGFMLRECQRHYAKTFAYGTAPAQNAGLANAISSDKDIAIIIATLQTNSIAGFTSANGNGWGPTAHWRLPVQMRTTPTITTYNPSAANASFRLPLGSSEGAAVDSAATVSPSSSTGDQGVTIVGVGATVGIISSFATNAKGPTAYIHAQADAGL